MKISKNDGHLNKIFPMATRHTVTRFFKSTDEEKKIGMEKKERPVPKTEH